MKVKIEFDYETNEDFEAGEGQTKAETVKEQILSGDIDISDYLTEESIKVS